MKDIFIIVQAKVIAIIMIQLFEIIILSSYSDLTFIITVNTEAVNSLSDYSSILDLRRKLQWISAFKYSKISIIRYYA